MFDIALSMQIVLAALLGGRGTVWGPVLGRVPRASRSPRSPTPRSVAQDAGAIRLLMFGGLLLAVALLLPRGILPTATDLLRRRRAAGEASRTGGRLGDAGRYRTRPRAVGSRSPAATEQCAALLALHDVTMRFGGVTALDHVDLDDRRRGRSPR